ncbi:YdcF family protein [Acidobacterium sp. S8]|uniref:YdcF family protein n=1 Tax=Acidobacterium sp. S8 TaxID=1641854 RepID=UPI0020B1195C|nr:YdcF family protein [Acidobacterium sp. S8]
MSFFAFATFRQLFGAVWHTMYPVLMRTTLKILIVLIIVCLICPATVLGLYFFASSQNANLNKVDALIVLGCPTKADGSPTPEQRERVMEGVREYQKGVSSEIIITGTAAHNQFVEAHDTIQNIYYSNKIMEAHGWHTTEVISSPYHLPRTALILHHYPQLQWKTHPAQWPPEYSLSKKLQLEWKEARTCFRIHLHGFPPSKYLPN